MKAIETRLRGFECGFGFFAGDEVKSSKHGEGRVVCVYRKSKSVQIFWYKKEQFGIFHFASDKDIKKKGTRVEAPMFPKALLISIYSSYNEMHRVLFLYHFYGCKKTAVPSICAKLRLEREQVVEVLHKAKVKGLLGVA